MADTHEGKAQQVRGAEVRATGDAAHPNGKGEAGSVGGQVGLLGLGAVGANCPGGNLPPTVAGGIVAQLIEDARDRLSEAEECIQWYQRSADKAQRQLDHLTALADLLNADQQTGN